MATIAALLVLLALVGDVFIENFGEKLAERLTFAKEYDLGHGGRYSRYALSIPLIIDHPLGMGLFEIDRIFDEPIHNIWLSSFLNYGWLAGFCWTLLMFLLGPRDLPELQGDPEYLLPGRLLSAGRRSCHAPSSTRPNAGGRSGCSPAWSGASTYAISWPLAPRWAGGFSSNPPGRAKGWSRNRGGTRPP
jgi:hypothetical protein